MRRRAQCRADPAAVHEPCRNSLVSYGRALDDREARSAMSAIDYGRPAPVIRSVRLSSGTTGKRLGRSTLWPPPPFMPSRRRDRRASVSIIVAVSGSVKGRGSSAHLPIPRPRPFSSASGNLPRCPTSLVRPLTRSRQRCAADDRKQFACVPGRAGRCSLGVTGTAHSAKPAAELKFADQSCGVLRRMRLYDHLCPRSLARHNGCAFRRQAQQSVQPEHAGAPS